MFFTRKKSAEDILKQGGAVFFLSGLESEAGAPHCAYVAIRGDRLEAFFRAAVGRGKYAIHRFGVILVSAEGYVPTPAMQKEVKQKYGIDPEQATTLPTLVRNHT